MSTNNPTKEEKKEDIPQVEYNADEKPEALKKKLEHIRHGNDPVDFEAIPEEYLVRTFGITDRELLVASIPLGHKVRWVQNGLKIYNEHGKIERHALAINRIEKLINEGFYKDRIEARKKLLDGDAVKAQIFKSFKRELKLAARQSESISPDYEELRQTCARDLETFAAIFFSDIHVTKPFCSFHLELMTDLYYFVTGSRYENIARLQQVNETREQSTSDNVHYVKYASASDAQTDTNNIESLEKEHNESALKIEKSVEVEQKPAQINEGGGPGPSVGADDSLTLENFSDHLDNVNTASTPIEHPLPNIELPPNYKFPDNLERHTRFDRFAVAAPRGHAKSTIVSLIFVAWCIVYDVHKFILLLSDSEDQAKLLLDAVKSELENNERLRAVYGDMVGGRIWGELVIETATNLRVQARGAGQRIRGLKYRSERVGLAVIDDLESDQLMESEDSRRKVKRWFYSALLPALKSEGKAVMIGTVLHEDALLPELLSSWPSRKYAADKNFSPMCDNPLWPEHLDQEDLLKIKEDYAARGFSDLFFREYFNQIVSPEDALFRKENFKYISHKDLTERFGRGENFRCFLTIDPAISVGSQHDYTAFVIVYVDTQNNLYVGDVLRGRWPIPGTIDIFFNLLEKYKFDGIGMQRIDWDRVFKVPMQTEMRRRNVFARVQVLQTYSPLNKGLASKKSRISRLAPRYHAGSIYHVKEARGIKALEEELLCFPQSKYDDVMDCLSMQLDLIFAPSKKNTTRPEHRFKYEDIANKISGY